MSDRIRLRDWWYAPVLIVLGILLPGWFAPPAHADVNSDAFIMTLDSEGITYTSETAIADENFDPSVDGDK